MYMESKEEFKRKLKEQQIFDEIKDDLSITYMCNLRWYVHENELEDKVNINRLYIKLVNYRIKRYGSSIMTILRGREDRGKSITNDYDRRGVR